MTHSALYAQALARSSITQAMHYAAIHGLDPYVVYTHFPTVQAQHSTGGADVACEACRSRVDPDRLLTCRHCGATAHVYCLEEPWMHTVPKTWVCPSCAPTIHGQPLTKDDMERMTSAFFCQDVPGTKVGHKDYWQPSEAFFEHASGEVGVLKQGTMHWIDTPSST